MLGLLTLAGGSRRTDMERGIRPLNVTLLTLLVVATVSGVVAFGLGSPGPARWVVAVHGGSGLAMLLLAPAKFRIARRGLRRPGRPRKILSLAFTVLVLGAIGSGLLHAVGGWRPYLGLLPMQVHVGAAVGAVALLAAHVVMHHRSARRRWRPLLRHTDLTRRRALLGIGVATGSTALWVISQESPRRATGSHEVGSGNIAIVPVTQWMFDPVPSISAQHWRLSTPSGSFDMAAVAALPQSTVRAVLDCTGGWFTEQEWRGVPLSALGLPQGAAIDVVSATGYRRRFPAHQAETLLLATHASGRPLSRGHGGPARIVAPGRRGFWWVKWVASIEVVDEPWWWQPPFPLQ
jgi:DMSO/TMAO reductase YedYZ molybdopterin-dependent catalytic subunit